MRRPSEIFLILRRRSFFLHRAEIFFLRLGDFEFIDNSSLAKETINRCSDLSRGMSHSIANWVGGDKKRPIDICRRKFMQIFSAKSLSKKLRAVKFWREKTISRSFTHGVFCATAGSDSLSESTGEQFFSDKTSLNLGRNKISFHILDEDWTSQCIWNHYLTN